MPFDEIIGHTEVTNLAKYKGINVNIDNKRIIKLNYYNKRNVTSCSCLGSLCCKCRVTTRERILKVI